MIAMSNQECIPIVNRPNTRLVRQVEGENSVRAYRESPDSVLVQFRAKTGTNTSGTRIMNVSLSFEEARAFAARILAAVEG